MKKIGYARVSTPEQSHDRQIAGLRELCDELYIETLSACSKRRPVYETVLSKLRAGDMLVVWDLDRAYRSTIDALTEAEKLRARQVHFQVAMLNIDTTTPAGLFVYTMQSALATYERQTLSVRTKEGLAAARARGSRIGRPPTLTSRQLGYARERLKDDDTLSKSALARDMGVPRWTLSRALSRTTT